MLSRIARNLLDFLAEFTPSGASDAAQQDSEEKPSGGTSAAEAKKRQSENASMKASGTASAEKKAEDDVKVAVQVDEEAVAEAPSSDIEEKKLQLQDDSMTSTKRLREKPGTAPPLESRFAEAVAKGSSSKTMMGSMSTSAASLSEDDVVSTASFTTTASLFSSATTAAAAQQVSSKHLLAAPPGFRAGGGPPQPYAAGEGSDASSSTKEGNTNTILRGTTSGPGGDPSGASALSEIVGENPAVTPKVLTTAVVPDQVISNEDDLQALSDRERICLELKVDFFVIMSWLIRHVDKNPEAGAIGGLGDIADYLRKVPKAVRDAVLHCGFRIEKDVIGVLAREDAQFLAGNSSIDPIRQHYKSNVVRTCLIKAGHSVARSEQKPLHGGPSIE
ncbi:unnamed protein product [Amoebophrya sp. A25]|nr:unnamed protein product [Amoebophrya sp. A25]|eukprot:GSA25T00000697001.1